MPKRVVPSSIHQSSVQGSSSAESSDIDGDYDASQPITVPRHHHRGRSKGRQLVNYPRPQSHLFRERFGGRPRGGKHSRRHDNSLYLTTLHQIDEEEWEDYNNVVPEHNTGFKRLFTSGEDQKSWNEFDGLSEEEQDKLLSKVIMTSYIKQPQRTRVAPDLHKLDSLDPRLRKLLLHTKRIPKDFMENVETDLREYFYDDELSVMVFIQLTSFQRMLIHGICQYIGLSVQRIELDGEVTLAVSTEHGKTFSPPDQVLHTILQKT